MEKKTKFTKFFYWSILAFYFFLLFQEAVHDYPIRKSPSVSSLAPSLALPQHFREAERFITTAPLYKPHIYDWYNNSYSRARWLVSVS